VLIKKSEVFSRNRPILRSVRSRRDERSLVCPSRYECLFQSRIPSSGPVVEQGYQQWFGCVLKVAHPFFVALATGCTRLERHISRDLLPSRVSPLKIEATVARRAFIAKLLRDPLSEDVFLATTGLATEGAHVTDYSMSAFFRQTLLGMTR
jgi:hypothetical protein